MGRHRKPRHLTYFDCPSCNGRVVIDLDQITTNGIWEMFGIEPKVDDLPKPVLEAAEAIVEQHEAKHEMAA